MFIRETTNMQTRRSERARGALILPAPGSYSSEKALPPVNRRATMRKRESDLNQFKKLLAVMIQLKDLCPYIKLEIRYVDVPIS